MPRLSIVLCALTSLLGACSSPSDGPGGPGGPNHPGPLLADITWPVSSMDAAGRALNVIQTTYRCNGAVAVADTVNAALRYSGPADSIALIWNQSSCRAQELVGPSPVILGSWTRGSLDEFPLPPADRPPQCTDTAVHHDTTGLFKTFEQIVDIDSAKMSTKIYGKLCLGDYFADSLVKRYPNFQLRVSAKYCDSAHVENLANNKVATLQGSLLNATLYGRFEHGGDTCRFAAAAPFPFNSTPPNCADVVSQAVGNITLCVLGSGFFSN